MKELLKNKIVMSLLSTNMIFGTLIFLFLGMMIMGAAEEAENSTSTCTTTDLPVVISQQANTIQIEMEKYSIPAKYLDILLAQLYQESGAIEQVLATDPWQSSESYCGSRGCITSPSLSTNQAMKVHSQNINLAQTLGIEVTEDVILQSYNFGSGYLYWLNEKKYTHSEDIAYEYSSYMTVKNPIYANVCNLDSKKKACYGDYKYVSHVKSKLGNCAVGNTIEIKEGDLYKPYFEGTYIVSCKIGCYGGHKGTDLVNQTDKKVYAVGSGVVESANNDCPQAGYLGNFCGEGLGNHVIIKHNLSGVNMYSIYGHMSKTIVTKGEQVDANTVLGSQGNSGNSSGEHLHLEFRYRTLDYGNYVDFYPQIKPRERS